MKHRPFLAVLGLGLGAIAGAPILLKAPVPECGKGLRSRFDPYPVCDADSLRSSSGEIPEGREVRRELSASQSELEPVEIVVRLYSPARVRMDGIIELWSEFPGEAVRDAWHGEDEPGPEHVAMFGYERAEYKRAEGGIAGAPNQFLGGEMVIRADEHPRPTWVRVRPFRCETPTGVILDFPAELVPIPSAPVGGRTQVEVSLKLSAWLSARLSDSLGEPLEGAHAFLDSMESVKATSDADGDLLLGPAPAGAATLVILSEQPGKGVRWSRDVVVLPGVETALGSFFLKEPPPLASGTIVGPDGHPLDCDVVLRDRRESYLECRTDVEGHFFLAAEPIDGLELAVYPYEWRRFASFSPSLEGEALSLWVVAEPHPEPLVELTVEVQVPGRLGESAWNDEKLEFRLWDRSGKAVPFLRPPSQWGCWYVPSGAAFDLGFHPPGEYELAIRLLEQGLAGRTRLIVPAGAEEHVFGVVLLPSFDRR